MAEALLLASRLASILIGVGGSLAVVLAALRGRVAWLPAVATVVLLVPIALTAAAASLASAMGGAVPAWIPPLAGATWFALFPLLGATFPSGRFVPRWSVWFVIVSIAVAVVDAVAGGFLSNLEHWWMYAVAQGIVIIALVAYRYRTSATTPERESVRWVLLGVLVTVTAFMALATAGGPIGGPDPLGAAGATAALLPLMCGLVIGLVRPRLWNVDATFRAVLSVLIAGWALVGIAASASLAGAPAALVAVAVTSPPIAWLASRSATWLVYRSRLGPDAAVHRLAASLESDALESIPSRIAGVARGATGSAAVHLTAVADRERLLFDAVSVAQSDPGAAEQDGARNERFPVVFRSELLAELRVAPRPGESMLSSRDRTAMREIARHAGTALHGVRALHEATAAQSALVTAREEERRRLRRDLHDDLGPTLSGLALGAAALARRAEAVDPALALGISDLQADIRAAGARAREISHGLRPAVLDDRGLIASIRTLVVEPMSRDLEVQVITDGDVDDLPAAVDVAVLRIVQEAVENVHRHAAARVCVVVLAGTESVLQVTIEDDGTGMPATVTPGVGLRSIRERATELGGRVRIAQREPAGTRVTVWLPLTRREREDAQA